MKIGIVDYGLGNLGSVYSAFRFYKFETVLISDPKELKKADVIVLAGVGNFKAAVLKLKKLGFWNVLNHEILEVKKPILGICLGMQLFSDISYEGGDTKGFGWIKGNVVKMDNRLARVPHIGWDEVEPMNKELFKGIKSNSFYFMHSYHFLPDDKSTIIGVTKYGGLEIASALKKDNVVGVQFHPEKSQGDGLRFLRNFIEALDL